jgi:chromosome segregation ATPase
MGEPVISVSSTCHLQETDTEVATLTEKLHATTDLLMASHKECNELSTKCSTLLFELSRCRSSLKNTERLKEVTLYNY